MGIPHLQTYLGSAEGPAHICHRGAHAPDPLDLILEALQVFDVSDGLPSLRRLAEESQRCPAPRSVRPRVDDGTGLQ